MKNNFFNAFQCVLLNELIDEGIDNAIDKMINEAGANALLLFTHHGLISPKKYNQQAPHSRYRDPEIEGYFFDVDQKYFKNTKIKPTKSKTKELVGRDAFGEIARVAKDKGLIVYAILVHRPVSGHDVREYDKYEDLHMRAVNGQKIPAVLCHNQPEVKKYYKAMIDNLHDKYKEVLDGFCFALLDHYALFGFATLADELADRLHIKRFSNPEMGLSCFCNVCVAQAKKEGIDVEKVKKGILKGIELGYIPDKIERMFNAHEVFRFLVDVPEYLEWLRFRSSIHTEIHKNYYEYVKEKNSSYKVGLDIYGAKDDWKYQVRFHELAKYCEWIKPMFYSSTYEESVGTKDIGEGVKICKSVTDKPIYPGILCGTTTPKEEIKERIDFAIENGADGLVLSWDYVIIPYENMNVVRDRLKELGKI